MSNLVILDSTDSDEAQLEQLRAAMRQAAEQWCAEVKGTRSAR